MMEIKISEAVKTKMMKVQMMNKARKRIKRRRTQNQKAKVNQKEKIEKRSLVLLLRNHNVKIND
jgi:hypothetical protein